MSNVTIEADNKVAADVQPKTETKQKGRAKGAKPDAERSNKKAEVLAMIRYG